MENERIERKLPDLGKIYQELFNYSLDLIYVLDLNGNFIDANDVAITAFEYERDELLNLSFKDLIDKDQLVKVSNSLKEIEEKGKQLVPRNYKIKTKKGVFIIIESYGIPIKEKNTSYGILSIAREITTQKKLKHKLKETLRKYQSILNNINEGYFEVGLEGNFTFINDSITLLTGYSKEELMGENYRKLMDEINRKRIYILCNEVYTSEIGKTGIQFEIIRKDRELVYVESSVYLRNDLKGNHVGFFGFVRDITTKKEIEALERTFKEQLEEQVEIRTKKLNEALKQQKLYLDQIVKSSQFKSEFLATMSHELRTPLNAIIGFTELLLEGIVGELNEEQLDYLNDIKTSAEHQFEMIKHILDISKIEAGQLNLNKDKFSLNNMIHQIKSTLRPLYKKKKLKFRVNGLDNEKEIYADPIKFKEILLNLLDNAIKFTITGQITISIQEKYDHWLFKVKDTGIGIARKDFNLIFKEFKRIDSTYVRSTPGTGLGLSLTKRLVELHGGEINFFSFEGIGTTFTFSIPKEKEYR